MPQIRIDDLADPRLEIYCNLKATNATRYSGLFVLEGEKLLDQLLNSALYPVHSVLTTERKVAEIAPKLDPDVPLYVVTQERISALVGYNFHQGVLACGKERAWPSPLELAQLALKRSDRLTFVVCPAVQNPENLGAIVRISDVFGVDAVLAGPDCPDPLASRVLRVSMGTVLRLPVCRVANLEQSLIQLQNELNVELVATVTDPAVEKLGQFRRANRMALLLGNESSGLTEDWVNRCPRKLTIPMRPDAESLNVSVATGVILFGLTTGCYDQDPSTRQPLPF